MKEFIFTWSIKNISYSWHKTGENMTSPRFIADTIHNSAWILVLYPRGKEDSDFLSLYLFRETDNSPTSLSVNFELSCISSDASPLNTWFVPEKFANFIRGGHGFGESRFIQRHEVFGRRKALYLPEDTLALRCRIWKDEGLVHELEQGFASTRLSTQRIVSVERIDPDYSAEKTFRIESIDTNKAIVSVSVQCYCDKIDVSINPINEEKTKSSKLKLSVVDKKGTKLCEHISCFFGELYPEFWQLPFSNKVIYADIKNSNENNLDFVAELVYSTGKEVKTVEKEYPHRIPEFLSNYMVSCDSETDFPTIFEDLRNLWPELCDVTLKVQNDQYTAHKVMLCARSSVFLAMLTGEMKEKISECIEIEDISADSMGLFLEFLYTDTFEDVEWEEAIELYYAADKYHVERLKLLCCSYFLKSVDVENVGELLVLADIHNDSELKRNVKEFIWENEEKVFTSSAWKEFATECPQMAMETMFSKYDEENQDFPETYHQKISRCPSIREDFKSLFKGHLASDVVIKTATSSFPAHKAVLCARSSSLWEVFRNDSEDKPTDVFEISDLEDDTVSRMLNFLYTDNLGDIQWDTAIKLYQAAKAYQIQQLFVKCSHFLLRNLRVPNASDLLLLAHQNNDVKLKAAVENYILLYDEEVFGSEEWAAFCETNFRLALEVMRGKYIKKMNCK